MVQKLPEAIQHNSPAAAFYPLMLIKLLQQKII
jgi:hypothetical protein